MQHCITNLAVDNPGTGGVGRGGRLGVSCVRPRPDCLVCGNNPILFPLDIRQLDNLLLPGKVELLSSLMNISASLSLRCVTWVLI